MPYIELVNLKDNRHTVHFAGQFGPIKGRTEMLQNFPKLFFGFQHGTTSATDAYPFIPTSRSKLMNHPVDSTYIVAFGSFFRSLDMFLKPRAALLALRNALL